MKYFCVYVKTGSEDFFKKEAQKQVGLLDEQSEFYFFSSLLWHGKASRGETEVKAQILGYVFFRVQELTIEIIQAIKKIKGFIHFLPLNDNIGQLKGKDFEILNYMLSYGEVLPMSMAEYTEGDRIKIISGPLKDLEGYIYHIDRRTQRVIVMAPLFSSMTKMELSYKCLEKIDDKV